MKRAFIAIAAIMAFQCMDGMAEARRAGVDPCMDCHEEVTPGILEQYGTSRHSIKGVGCLACHESGKEDPSGYRHNGFMVTPVVTPRHCEKCHPQEVKEFRESMHDEAAFFTMSAYATVGTEYYDKSVTHGATLNYKANYSRESAEAGCLDCHGTVIEVTRDGELLNWPNVGIGRLNPDGSAGSCSACHTRHSFSLAQARKPETCGQCHLGPDHPQREIYEESKHGNLYAANGDKWNFDARDWGPRDIEAPTCATCHMSGFGGGVRKTHNVSARLKWELETMFTWPTTRAYMNGEEKYPIPRRIGERYEQLFGLNKGELREVDSGLPNPFAIAKQFAPDIYDRYVGKGKWWTKGDDRFDAIGADARRTPEMKRADMLAVCGQCHSRRWAEGDMRKADALIDVYNATVLGVKRKYFDPIKDGGLDDGIKFNGISRADTIWHEVWHHEGRIWRMGAFMQGQAWQHWEGAYKVSVDITRFADLLEDLRLRQTLKTGR